MPKQGQEPDKFWENRSGTSKKINVCKQEFGDIRRCAGMPKVRHPSGPGREVRSKQRRPASEASGARKVGRYRLEAKRKMCQDCN